MEESGSGAINGTAPVQDSIPELNEPLSPPVPAELQPEVCIEAIDQPLD